MQETSRYGNVRRPSLITEQSMYVPSPGHWRAAVTTNDGPLLGSGVPRPYSIPAEHPRPSDAYTQPAFDIQPPMQPVDTCPDSFQMASFQYGGGPRGVFPTWFRPANRAAARADDPSSGKPLGVRLLLLSPARYSFWHAHQATPQDVRLGLLQRKPLRGRVPSIPLGG